MQSHKSLKRVADHLVGDDWQVEHFTKGRIFSKSNYTYRPLEEANAKLGGQTTQSIDQLRPFDGPESREPGEGIAKLVAHPP